MTLLASTTSACCFVCSALGYLRLVKKTQRRGAIEHHYAAVGADDPERVVAQLAGRFLTTPETKLMSRTLLDATAIAELHADLERLFRRTRASWSRRQWRGQD